MERFRPINILLVEDSLGDIRLTQEALKESKLKINLHTVMDGVEAMEFLHREGRFAEKPVPDLILLDLNLPRKDGRQVLKEIKEDAKLRNIPVSILSISRSDEDIMNAYDLHVNCYIIKPLDMNKFIDVVKAIENFWFTIVSLPPRSTKDDAL